jgi:hypothetical protein
MQVLMVVDDIDGRTAADERITLGWNGKAYALDLTTAHAEELHKLIDPWIEAATAIDLDSFERSGRKSVKQRPARTHAQRMTAKRLRAWALTQPEYADRINPAGQFPQDAIDGWNKTHPKDIYERHVGND